MDADHHQAGIFIFGSPGFIYGSSRRLLMHEYVQKLTSTTFSVQRLGVQRSGVDPGHRAIQSGIRPSSPVTDAIATAPPMRAVGANPKGKIFITKTPIASARCRRGQSRRGRSLRQLFPGLLRTMYAAYQSGQFASRCPVRFSCSQCAASARRRALARSFDEAKAVSARSMRPGSRL